MNSRTCCGLLSVFGPLTITGCLFVLGAFINPLDGLSSPIKKIVLLFLLPSAIDYIWSMLWWTLYQPTEAVSDLAALPSVTVVVPVYNESRFVRYALYSILRSCYPRDRLEVVVVDDGSLDDSWEHITATANAYDNTGISYRTIRHTRNLGKRFAIHSGFSIAKGNIIVSLDSDSVLEINSLSELVAPLVHDSHIGGVAGHLSVLNAEKKLIPRLLDVLFDMSGNIPRAAQSRAGRAVSILPGALSAYRAVAIRSLIADLCSTTFMGTPLQHGEDIEMTLGLLRTGWATVYQSSAVVHTMAPETARAALLTYVRWERSSYVYLLLGNFQVAATAVLAHLYKGQSWNLIEHQYTDATDRNCDWMPKPDRDCPEASTSSIAGSLFLLVNLISTATSNLMLPFLLFIQARNICLRPQFLPVNLLAMVLSSGFRHALFFADVSRHEEESKGIHTDTRLPSPRSHTQGQGCNLAAVDFEGSLEELESLPIVDQRSKLLWRLKYGVPAVLFHATVISWSSFIAVFTLKSQKWLTR